MTGLSGSWRAAQDQRAAAPATAANLSRNARADRDRHARWAPLRDAVWSLVEPLLGAGAGARVAIVGAGNGDTLPLGRIAGRAARLELLDLDERALRAARRRCARRDREIVGIGRCDITAGAADAIVAQAPQVPELCAAPLPGAPYDLVIGDLFYSQLLYPGLRDREVAGGRMRVLLGRHGPPLTEAVVARLHASAPSGQVLHLHDTLGWWDGHEQPITLGDVLAAPDAAAGLALAEGGSGPGYADPRRALVPLGIPVRRTALWCWPFIDGVDYLVVATLAGGSALDA